MRGDVYRLKAPRGAVGREQAGARYAVDLQDDGLAISTMIVAPTSRSAGPAVYRPVIELGTDETRVLVEQMASVDPSRLGDQVGRVTNRELGEIETAIRLLLDL